MILIKSEKLIDLATHNRRRSVSLHTWLYMYRPYSRDCATLHRLLDVCRPYRAHCLIDLLSHCLIVSLTRRLGDSVTSVSLTCTDVLKYLHLMDCDFVEAFQAFALGDSFMD